MTFAPKAWQNSPSTATPITAAALIDLETRLSAYTDAASPTLGALTATAGRTSAFAAPVLRDFASVMDAPFNAKGDARRVTDGAIGTGTALLSSASAAFTVADIGKRVDVLGAGAAGATLFASILSVAGGVATLSVTAGTTVSGATVTYGTEDTAAIQAAMNAVSTAGGGMLVIPGYRNFLIGKVVPKSNVTVWAYGATIYLTAYSTHCGFQALGGDGSISNWSLYGATMRHDGVSYSFVWTTGCVYIAGDGGHSDIRVQDCHFLDNKDCAVNVDEATRVWITGNDVVNCCQSNGRNALAANILLPAATSTAAVHIQGNHIESCPTECISIVTTGTVNLLSPDLHIAVTDNVLRLGTGVGIQFEGTSCGGGKALIANNLISGTMDSAIKVSQGLNQGPWLDFAITGNVIQALNYGIWIDANEVACTGNVIKSGNYGIFVTGTNPTVTATLDGTTNVLTSVSIPSGTPAVNGTIVAGTGIPLGSYLVSGAGTTTWTISQNTTAPATESVTFVKAQPNVVIADNIIRLAVNPSGSGIQASGLVDASVTGNIITFDTGSTSSTFGYGIFLSNAFYATVANNRVRWAPANGIRIANSHDISLIGNALVNSSELGVGNSAGLVVYGLTGTYNPIIANNIVDDRTTPKQTYGIQSSLGGQGISLNLYAFDNTLSGFQTGNVNSVAEYVTLRNNPGYNPHGTSTPGVPSSGVAVVAVPFDRTYYVQAGASTVTMAIQNGPSPVIPASAFAAIRVPAGKTVTPTYANAPTWVAESE